MLRLALVAGIIPASYWLYNILFFEIDPFLRSWTSQNRVLSPHPAHYFLAFGVVMPLVVIGSRRILAKDAWRGWLVVGWVLCLPILAYAPFTLQRRLPEGVWVALIVLVMFAWENWQIYKLERKLLIIGLVVVSTFSTLILWSGSVQAVLEPGNPLFIDADQAKVFEYLEVNAGEDEVVLAAYETGNALPAWTPQFVVIGHGSETAQIDNYRKRVADFFDEHSNENNRLGLLLNLGVDYVVWGPGERRLGDWNPVRASYLDTIYQQGEYTLFKVRPSP
jgi:hypothetical protein